MGDYIPQEELEKFMASCNDVAAQKAARDAAEKAKIQADNVGHKLLSKMGWKEGALYFSQSFYLSSARMNFLETGFQKNWLKQSSSCYLLM